MPTELERLFADLDQDQLGFRRPSKFIFFCGGANAHDPTKPTSLRDYLLNDRAIGRRLKAEVVRAESANKIWRETTYSDLITFEEDIAKIAAMILIIVESPGAFAELGAFASIETTQDFLSIIVQAKFSEDESFVRLGPVERIMRADEDRVAFYPWETRRNGTLLKSTVKPHIKNLTAFLNKGLGKISDAARLEAHPTVKEYIFLYWVIYLSQAIPVTKLTTYAAPLIPGIDLARATRALYCMKIAGWIASIRYSNVEYYYCLFDMDPLIYRFKSDLPKAERDASRRKTDVGNSISKELKLPKHIKNLAFDARKASKK